MRSLCFLDAVFWKPMPEHNTLAGLPLAIYKRLLTYIFEVEVKPQLFHHYCDPSAPCAVLRKVMETCAPHLFVCRTWNKLASAFLIQPQFEILRSSQSSLYRDGSSESVAMRYILGGRYRAYYTIEEAYEKSVLTAFDYSSAEGCYNAVEVIIKISSDKEKYQTEKEVYSWLADAKIRPSYVPHLYLGSEYLKTEFYGLVLSKLGCDLEKMRCRRTAQRFTPKMTLAVAIQTIGIYEKFHRQGWLHLNAKPGNFAIGPDQPGENTRIFMFDFEESRSIQSNLVKGNNNDIAWNWLFKATNPGLGLSPSRRDDMEGLAYVFSYLERGFLPWKHAGSSEEACKRKLCTPTDKLFEGMDTAYWLYYNDVKALAWGECPNYKKLVRRFVRVWEERDYGGTPGELDWWGELELRA